MNPTSDRQYVETVDGLGYLTGHRKEQDGMFFPEEKRERLRYNIGVVILKERIERFLLSAKHLGSATRGHHRFVAVETLTQDTRLVRSYPNPQGRRSHCCGTHRCISQDCS